MLNSRFISGVILLFFLQISMQAQTVLADTLAEFSIVGSKAGVEDVFVLDSIHLEEVPAQSDVARLLMSETALYIKDYGVGNIATISMRGGAAAHTKVSWNGIPMNSPTLGSTDLSLLPTALATDIDVHHGAAGTVGTAGGLGGGIDVRSEASGPSGLQLSASYVPLLQSDSKSVIWTMKKGRFNSRTAVMRSQAENAFDYTRMTSRGPVEESRENASAMLTAFGHSARLVHRLAVSEWNVDHVQTNRQIASPVGTTLRGENQYDRANRLRYGLSTKKSAVTIAYLNDIQEYADSLSGFHDVISSDRAHLHVDHTFFKNEVSVVTGRIEADHVTAKVSSAENKNRRQTQATMLKVHQRLGERLDIDLSTRAQLTDEKLDPLTAVLGVMYRPLAVSHTTVHAIISRTHRLPTFNDLYWPGAGDPALDPERGWATEYGLRWLKECNSWSLVYYRNVMDRLIAWVPDEDGLWRPENVDDVRSQGLEARFSWTTNGFTINGSHRYDRSVEERSVENGSERRQRLYSPRHIAILQVATKKDHLLSPYLSGRYVSEVYVDGRSDETLEGHAVVDCGLTFSLDSAKAISLDLRLNNLLGNNYEVVAGRPQAGRHAQFILTYTLAS